MRSGEKTRAPEKRKSQSQKPAGSKTNIISFKESDILQRWLITAQGCPVCAQIKKDMKKEFAAGIIKATDVGDDKGFEILTTLGIAEAPDVCNRAQTKSPKRNTLYNRRMSDDTRFRIFKLLVAAKREMTLSSIARKLHLDQQRVAYHLPFLVESGLINP